MQLLLLPYFTLGGCSVYSQNLKVFFLIEEQRIDRITAAAARSARRRASSALKNTSADGDPRAHYAKTHLPQPVPLHISPGRAKYRTVPAGESRGRIGGVRRAEQMGSKRCRPRWPCSGEQLRQEVCPWQRLTLTGQERTRALGETRLVS